MGKCAGKEEFVLIVENLAAKMRKIMSQKEEIIKQILIYFLATRSVWLNGRMTGHVTRRYYLFCEEAGDEYNIGATVTPSNQQKFTQFRITDNADGTAWIKGRRPIPCQSHRR